MAADALTLPDWVVSRKNAAAEIADLVEARNFHLAGANPPGPLAASLTQEPLTYAAGGFDAANLQAQARVVAVPGPRCTILGIAREMVITFNSAAANDAQKLSVEDLARALYVYNAAWLGKLGILPTGAPILFSWRVGCHFTLPIEPRPGGASPRFVTDLAALKVLAGAFDDTLEPVLYAEAIALDPLPDCDQLIADAASRLTTWKDRDQIVKGLVANLLLNPCDELLLAVETLLARKSTDAVDIVLAVVKRLPASHLELLAQSMAGYAALRQFFFVLQPAPGSTDRTLCLDKLGAALVLAKDTGGLWVDPREVGPNPPVPPVDPPLLERQRVAVDKLVPKTVLVGMVYGRIVPVGTAISYTRRNDKTVWIGPSELGQVDPIGWLKANEALLAKDLGPPAPPVGSGVPVPAARTLERIKLAAKIAENEGLLDACRAADIGIISTGLHQWSIHTGDELAVLLERFRLQSPEHYDLYFGAFGLQTRTWARPIKVGVEITKRVDKKDVKSGITKFAELDPDDPATYELGANKTIIDLATYNPSSYKDRPGDFKANPYDFRLLPAAFAAKVEEANPFGRDPSVDPLEYFPSYATVFKVAPGKKLQRLPPVGFDDGDFSDLMPRLEFFGGLAAKDRTRRFGSDWSARIRLAGRASMPYRLVQLHTAAWRFTRIDLEGNFIQKKFEVEGQLYTLPQLVSSTFGAACLLDLHINAPSNVRRAVDDAIARTPAPAHVGGLLDPQWRRRFTINIMSARRFPDASAKRDRDGRLISYHDQHPPAGAADHSLSTDPGSFTGWI